ncbi:ABC transporter permease [Streptomyces sp. ST2-7A]|uniref:ABC transporter permease n=1 Tax=Streptomyces sp. ST2-7A TaxID=2907214 RepID=UPI001F320D6A|nr:ABC transporter permease subunit [Streptomyces sp. ST2-7A]MCE7079599.1 ABC transporter permease subunit [Streptomyces sp. ST2-7A]
MRRRAPATIGNAPIRTTEAGGGTPDGPRPRRRGPLRRRLLAPVAAFVLLATVGLGPLLAPYPPNHTVGPPWASPDGSTLLGTDALGRDILSRVLAGGTGLLSLALVAALATVLLGTAAGLWSGWAGGRTARRVAWMCDLLLAVPAPVLALVLATALSGASAVITASVMAGAPLTARVVADEVAVLRRDGWVRVAVERGERVPAVLFRELLPALRGLVTADAGLRLVTALQLAAALSVLGLGPQPPTPDWALMLREGLPGAGLNPAALLAPALALALCAWVLGAAARSAGRPGGAG